MEKDATKRVMIGAIGAPKNGYQTVAWQMKDTIAKEPIPFLLMANRHKVDHLIVLGTEQSFNEQSAHYEQLMQGIQKYNLAEKFVPLATSGLQNADEFWAAFQTIIGRPEFNNTKLDLYVDLTFGYRTQPMLIFLAVYFLQEMREDVRIKKMYYGMNDTQPPQIVDMTELIELLDWIKAAQLFTTGGSAELLVEKMKTITGESYREVAEDFREFSYAYAFNYVSYLPQKAAQFQKGYNSKAFRKDIRNNFPVFSLIHGYINEFIKMFRTEDELGFQLSAVRKNLHDGAFSRAVLILRETYITLFMNLFELKSNSDRIRVEKTLINRVFWFTTDDPSKPNLSDHDKALARDTYQVLSRVFGDRLLNQYFTNWGVIRSMRNGAGHIRNIMSGDKKEGRFSNKFKELRKELEDYVRHTELLFVDMARQKSKAEKLRQEIYLLLDEQRDARLFVIINEGIHPVLEVLKMQYGADIRTEVLTSGNVGIDAENELAFKCKQISQTYPNFRIYLVPSGFSYLAVAAYNVLQQSLSKHPVWLQFDRKQGKYIEKNLDPRYLLSESFKDPAQT